MNKGSEDISETIVTINKILILDTQTKFKFRLDTSSMVSFPLIPKKLIPLKLQFRQAICITRVARIEQLVL